MAEEVDRHESAPGSVGHVSVHLEHMHPKDVRFSFETQAPRMSGALGFSTVFHAIAVLAVAFIALRISTTIAVAAISPRCFFLLLS